MADATLDSYLAALVAENGSDLHVKVGSPPRMRINGSLRAIQGEAEITPAMTERMAAARSLLRADFGMKPAAP